jgi:hypothetical protein
LGQARRALRSEGDHPGVSLSTHDNDGFTASPRACSVRHIYPFFRWRGIPSSRPVLRPIWPIWPACSARQAWRGAGSGFECAERAGHLVAECLGTEQRRSVAERQGRSRNVGLKHVPLIPAHAGIQIFFSSALDAFAGMSEIDVDSIPPDHALETNVDDGAFHRCRAGRAPLARPPPIGGRSPSRQPLCTTCELPQDSAGRHRHSHRGSQD